MYVHKRSGLLFATIVIVVLILMACGARGGGEQGSGDGEGYRIQLSHVVATDRTLHGPRDESGRGT